MDNIRILIEAVLGCSALTGYILYRKANRRIKDAEAREQEAKAKAQEVANEKALRDIYEESIREMRVEHAERTKELRSTIVDVNLMYHNALKDGARKDEIIDDKTALIRKLQEELLRTTRRVGLLERAVQYYKNWFCQREFGAGCDECDRREPAQNPPMKYQPPGKELLSIAASEGVK